ncbi:hypothetical protein FKM82_009229 [Ascaphus truei]
MAFFGITCLGYQDPFQAARIQGQRGDRGAAAGGRGENEESYVGQIRLPALVPPPLYISHEKYKESVRRIQITTTPNQTQRIPLTAGQLYGWWLPQDPKVKAECAYPWMQGPRHPMIRSPMTRFVDLMTLTHKDFSLF